LLIDEISEAAYEAIEQAAGEAAKAAILSMLEREAAALRAQAELSKEVEKLKTEAAREKKAGRKNAVLTGVICLISGFVIGSVTINSIRGK